MNCWSIGFHRPKDDCWPYRSGGILKLHHKPIHHGFAPRRKFSRHGHDGYDASGESGWYDGWDGSTGDWSGDHGKSHKVHMHWGHKGFKKRKHRKHHRHGDTSGCDRCRSTTTWDD